MNRTADHDDLGDLRDRAESMNHHRHLAEIALGCAAAVALIIFLASLAS